MRIVALAVLVLTLSACSSANPGNPQPAPGAAAPPASSAPKGSADRLEDRIAWVRSGTETDTGRYHSASIAGGPSTDLKNDIAFVSPSGKISCVTGYELRMEGLSCDVKLKTPVPKPHGGFGNWDGGYVDYSAKGLQVGQFRGDPGLFINGEGQPLPYDSKLTFGNYTCRLASTGLTCVNPTEKTGVHMSDDGIVPLGCLTEVPEARREPSVGHAFTC